MKNLFVSSIVLLGLSAPVMASDNFTGGYVGLSVNAGATTFKETSASYSLDGSGRGYFAATVDAGYGLSMGTSVLLMGATLDLNSPKAYSGSAMGLTSTVKQKSHWSLYVAPGMTLTKDALVYGKLAYHGMKGEISDGTDSESLKFKGLGFGVGTRVAINKNLSMVVEAQRVNYGAENDSTGTVRIKPTASIASVGLTYKF